MPEPHRFASAAFAAALLLTAGPVPAGGVEPVVYGPPFADVEWQVGALRRDGLRIVVTGRSDASAVLDPDRFAQPAARHAYRIATRIPGLLNQLYCWCGCHVSGLHRSVLACFEDEMAAECPVTQGTAQMADELHSEGLRARAIQDAVDAAWRRRNHEYPQRNDK